MRLRFGLPAMLPQTLRQRIKRADQVAAYWEAVLLAGFDDKEARRYFGRPGRIGRDAIAALLEPWPAKRAESDYLKSVRALIAATTETV